MKRTSTHRLIRSGSLAAALAALLVTPSAHAATWNLDTAGPSAWDDNASWTAAFPNATTDTANVINDITTDNAINLNAAITIGALNIGDANGDNKFTLAAGTAGSLILNATATPTIDRTATGTGADSITANISFSKASNIVVDSPNGALELSGLLTGGQTLTKSGTGTVILTANSYAGNTGSNLTVTSGTVMFKNCVSGTQWSVLNYGGPTLTVSGGTVDLNGGYVQCGKLTGSGGTILNNSATAATININGSNAGGGATYSGTIANGSGTTGLRMDGNNQSGSAILAGANTYTGTTTAYSGILKAGVASVAGVSGAFGNDSAVSVVARGVSSYAIIDLNGFDTQIGSLTGGDAYSKIILGTKTLSVGGNNTSPAAFTGVISGESGALTKLGSGTLTLSGANTYNGPTTITNGTLKATSSGALAGVGAATPINLTIGTAAVTVDGSTAAATLDLNGNITSSKSITLSGGTNGANLVNSTASTTATITGGIRGIEYTAAPTDVFAGAGLSFTGGTGSGATGTVNLGVTVASFAIAGGTTTYSTAPTVTISGGGGSGATATATLSADKVVSGITITSPGAGFTSLPTIAFTGGTVLVAGTNPTGTGVDGKFQVVSLTATAAGSYTGAPAVAFTGTGTGSLTASTTVGNAVTLTGLNNNIGGAGNLAIAAPIGQSAPGGGFTKIGNGTLTLNKSSSYTGGTTVTAGKVNFNAFSVTQAPVTINGGVAQSGNAMGIYASAVTVNVDGGLIGTGYSYFYVGSLAGSGNIVNNSDATWPLVIGHDATATNTTDYSGILSGIGGLEKRGTRTQILSGANIYTGATTISGGTLKLGAAGSIANSTGVSLAAGAVLDTTAHASFTMSASQPVTFHVNGTGAGSAGRLNADGLNITNAVVVFSEDNTLNDAVYVLANYTFGSLTGVKFQSVTPPSGYTVNYTYNGGTQIALVQSASAYTTWATGLANPAFDFDSDNNGLANGLQWILGGAQTQGNIAAIAPLETLNATDLQLAFKRVDAAVSETTLTAEWDVDLAGIWTSVPVNATTAGIHTYDNGVTVTVVTNDAAPDDITVKIPRSNAAPGTTLFARLKATQP